jgi:DNA polymerase I
MSTYTLNGGLGAAVPFPGVWCVDFEFNGGPGERPRPVCMVAKEWRSGREVRLWRDKLLALRKAPFDTGPDSLLVAYFASAELGCFAELGWPMPRNVLDLFVEHRVETNGLSLPKGRGLLASLAYHGLAHIDAGEKEKMRRLIMDNQSWSGTEKRAILDYCASDVEALIALLPQMAPVIDWPRALIRGRYMAAVARMEAAGVPIDLDRYERLAESWEPLKARLIAEVDQAYGVHDGITFKADRFAAWLARRGIPWPRLDSGGARPRWRHLWRHVQALSRAGPAARAAVHARRDAAVRAHHRCRRPEPLHAVALPLDDRP